MDILPYILMFFKKFVYLFERQRDKEIELPFLVHSPNAHSGCSLTEAKASSQEHNLGLPYGWQKPIT